MQRTNFKRGREGDGERIEGNIRKPEGNCSDERARTEINTQYHDNHVIHITLKTSQRQVALRARCA